MPYTYKIETLNINGISSPTRIHMLEEFLWHHEIDLALLQEVTPPNITAIRRCTAHTNIGTEGRGTALLVKDGQPLSNIECTPTGRGISTLFYGIRIHNIYAPSGAEKRREREDFYNEEVPRLILHPGNNILLAGDFNCALSNSDFTGPQTKIPALAKLVHGLDLVDVWDATEGRNVYTHYTAKGASRIDRIYISHQLLTSKQGAETVATAFSDHMADIFRLSLYTFLITWKRVLANERIVFGGSQRSPNPTTTLGAMAKELPNPYHVVVQTCKEKATPPSWPCGSGTSSGT
jgi:exonuclease III